MTKPTQDKPNDELREDNEWLIRLGSVDGSFKSIQIVGKKLVLEYLKAQEERAVLEGKLALLREAYKQPGTPMRGVSAVEAFIIDEMVKIEAQLTNQPPSDNKERV